MAHDDAREGKWRGNGRMEWVTSTLYTTSEHGISSITTADAHTLAASSRLNWRPCRFKWTRSFRRKTKSGFCACVIHHFSNAVYLLRSTHCTSCCLALPDSWFQSHCPLTQRFLFTFTPVSVLCEVRTDSVNFVSFLQTWRSSSRVIAGCTVIGKFLYCWLYPRVW
jgi:hypothetical protein